MHRIVTSNILHNTHINQLKRSTAYVPLDKHFGGRCTGSLPGTRPTHRLNKKKPLNQNDIQLLFTHGKVVGDWRNVSYFNFSFQQVTATHFINLNRMGPGLFRAQ